MYIYDSWDNIFTHIIVLYGNSGYMEPTAMTDKYCIISTTYTTTICYYVVKFLSEKVTLYAYNNIYDQVFKAGEILVKYE